MTLHVIDPKQGGTLREQNEGAAWLDCEARGLSHLWQWSHRHFDGEDGWDWWQCRRCPVTTRTRGVRPARATAA